MFYCVVIPPVALLIFALASLCFKPKYGQTIKSGIGTAIDGEELAPIESNGSDQDYEIAYDQPSRADPEPLSAQPCILVASEDLLSAPPAPLLSR